MTDSDSRVTNIDSPERKRRILMLGVGLGALCGLISSYLYSRAAEESGDNEGGEARSVSTGQLLAVLLAILGVIRQVAELGKPKKPGKK